VWANTVAAYETLPPVLRGLADQLWALHSNGYDYAATCPNATARQMQHSAPRLLHKLSADAKEAGPEATTPT
jgi:alpha-ketoglutarate-dependent taurine dioxygenase